MGRKTRYAIFNCLLLVTFVLAGCANNRMPGNEPGTSSTGQTLSGQPSSGQPSGNAPTGSQTSTDQQPAEQTPAGQQPAGQNSASQQPAGQNPASQQPAEQTPAGQQPAEQTPAGQQPTGQTPASQQPTGQNPGTSGQITLEEARNLALNAAGLTASDVTIYKEKTDYDDGRLEYEIEFVTAANRYEYELSANGTILESSAEPIEQIPANLTEGCITLEAAKSAALSHAKLTGDQVAYTKVELEYDDGIIVYEIELYSGGVEYSFEINASSGAVLEMDTER